ncbi:synapsin-1-like [Corvus kubaryi]|uniref:synapsin-1-like n=1 Tax=Corvus kubaryi TaxID=68294 RepID=UPI001C05478D|nr:synapsin-1-like [Corvus kubaryi]
MQSGFARTGRARSGRAACQQGTGLEHVPPQAERDPQGTAVSRSCPPGPGRGGSPAAASAARLPCPRLSSPGCAGFVRSGETGPPSRLPPGLSAGDRSSAGWSAVSASRSKPQSPGSIARYPGAARRLYFPSHLPPREKGVQKLWALGSPPASGRSRRPQPAALGAAHSHRIATERQEQVSGAPHPRPGAAGHGRVAPQELGRRGQGTRSAAGLRARCSGRAPPQLGPPRCAPRRGPPARQHAAPAGPPALISHPPRRTRIKRRPAAGAAPSPKGEPVPGWARTTNLSVNSRTR